MPPSAVEIRTLLAQSYLADPLIGWLFSGVDETQHAVAGWLGVFVERYLNSGHVDVVTRDHKLVGAALWIGPEGLSPGARGLPSSGGLFAAFVGAARATELGEALHKIAGTAPTEPHIYLNFFAVDADTRRVGVGSQLLARVLAEAEERQVGVYLETTNPAAVPFYEANGFHVTERLTLEASGPRLWAMFHD